MTKAKHKSKTQITLQVTPRQFHTILAGLRTLQVVTCLRNSTAAVRKLVTSKSLAETRQAIDDIATNMGEVEALGDLEISELCDALNTGKHDC